MHTIADGEDPSAHRRGRMEEVEMNTKYFSALTITLLLAISGVGAGEAQAAPLAPRPSVSPVGQPPLSPASQQNAVRKAKDYLDYDAFSRQGLIDQLVHDGYSAEDSTYAVDSIAIDWNQQAAKKAKDYLNYDAFSHSGLVGQLTHDGFTPAQAEYGVTAAGL
jgi:hypothetical protein